MARRIQGVRITRSALKKRQQKLLKKRRRKQVKGYPKRTLGKYSLGE